MTDPDTDTGWQTLEQTINPMSDQANRLWDIMVDTALGQNERPQDRPVYLPG